jgi:hypothetical protein
MLNNSALYSESLGFILAQRPIILRFFVVYLSPYRQILGLYPKLGNDCFLLVLPN